MRNCKLSNHLLGLIDNPGDNWTVKKEKMPQNAASSSKVVGPPGLEPGTP